MSKHARNGLPPALAIGRCLVLGVGLSWICPHESHSQLAPDHAFTARGSLRVDMRVPLFYQRPPLTPPAGRVAVIVDDMGRDLGVLETLGALGRPITVAVLPGQPQSREVSLLAARRGSQVMIHLPMEPLRDSVEEPGGNAIRVGMGLDEVVRVFEEAIRDVPGARGFNNHMGSRATRSRPLMERVLSHARNRGLFFVDSRTTSRSVALKTARELGVPAAARGVFLDADHSRYGIRRQIRELEALARREGVAVGIAHPYPETLQAIRDWMPEMEERGITLVYASEAAK